MSQLDKPNVVISLAASQNQRGIDGYTTAITNGVDQIKVNTIYEVVNNAGTGKKTLYLAKRPGIEDPMGGLTLAGTAAENPLVIISTGDGGVTNQWVFSKNGSNSSVANTSALTAILNSNNYWPVHASKTLISGTENVVVQLVFSSSVAHRVFYASAIGTWTEISDADFTSLIHRGKMEFMDGFAFALDSSNKIWNSDINSLANWSPTGFITKQIVQDAACGLARLNNQILAFGDETVEVFANAGNATGSPLQSVKQLSQRIGLGMSEFIRGTASAVAYRSYYCTIGARLFFIGKSGAGALRNNALMSYDGARFEKVQSEILNRWLAAKPSVVKGVYSVGVFGRDAVAIHLSDPTAATQVWLMYFPEWNEWFEWTSTFVQPANSGTYFLGIGNSSASSRMLGWFSGGNEVWADGTSAANSYQFKHQLKIPKNGNHRKFMRWAGIEGDTARSALNLSIEFSDDDYQTWQTARTVDLNTDKPHIYRCGSYRTRGVRLTHTGNAEVRIENFLARVDE